MKSFHHLNYFVRGIGYNRQQTVVNWSNNSFVCRKRSICDDCCAVGLAQIIALTGNLMTQATQQNDAVEALLRQTICNDLSLSPDLEDIWIGLYERIVGPRTIDMGASRAVRRCASGGTEAEEVGLSRIT